MSLTGTTFLYTLIVLSVAAVVLPLALWSRLRGPRIARAAARVLMASLSTTAPPKDREAEVEKARERSRLRFSRV